MTERTLMFKGSQNIFQSSRRKLGRFGRVVRQKLQSAEQLLADPDRRKPYVDVKQAIEFSHEDVEKFIEPLFYHFSDFVQLLPDAESGYFTGAGGLLQHALERTAASAKLAKEYFSSDNKDIEAMLPQKALWTYVIVSSSLLFEIGKVLVDMTVKLYDKNGSFLHNWQPLSGKMSTFASAYVHDLNHQYEVEFRNRVTVMLARQIVPEQGFVWISSDKDALSVWLALLEGDYVDSGGLKAVLDRAEADVYRDQAQKKGPLSKLHDRQQRKISQPLFAPVAVDSTDLISDPNRLAENFIEWMQKGFAAEAFALNVAGIYHNEGGMVITCEIFERWKAQNAELHTLDLSKVIEALATSMMLPAIKVQLFNNLKEGSTFLGVKLNNMNTLLPVDQPFKAMTPGSPNPVSITLDTLLQDPDLTNVAHLQPVPSLSL